MSLVLVSRPIKDVQESPEERSAWNAVWHPIIYHIQRQDFEVVSGDVVDNPGSGGDTQMTIIGAIISEMEVGQRFYLKYGSSFDDVYTVLEISFGGGNTVIIFDRGGFSFSSPASNGYINLIDSRSFYMIEIKIIRYDTDPSGEELSSSYCQFRPYNSAGDIKANIQAWLETMLTADNNFDYGVLNELNKTLGQGYTLEAREYWKEDGYTEWNEEIFDGSIEFVVNAVKQTGDRYGQNMAEYVMQTPNGSPQDNTFGKFLTAFDTPTFFVGFPFDISYLHTENIGSLAIVKSERRYNINGGLLGSSQSTLSTGEDEAIQFLGVMRMMLDGGYASNVHRVDVSLYADSVSVDTLISETKSIIVDQACYDNIEYLAWLNPSGGFDYWAFSGDQENRLTTSNEVSFERYVEDIGESDARSQTLKKQLQTDIVLGADSLKKQDLEAIKFVLSSPKVYRYLGLDENDEHKWQVVKVALGSFTMPKSSQDRGDISFMIFPPETYIQQQ